MARSARHAAALPLLALLAGCAAPPPAAPPPVTGSFGDFKPIPGRAHYLVCPQDYCLATPDELAPLRNVRAADLRDIVRRTLDAEPDISLLASSNEGLRLVYHQAGGLFGPAPGNVTVEIVDADEGLSGVVIYGESDEAAADPSAPRRRVRQFLADIDQAVARATRR
jgi:hypothetical protein